MANEIYNEQQNNDMVELQFDANLNENDTHELMEVHDNQSTAHAIESIDESNEHSTIIETRSGISNIDENQSFNMFLESVHTSNVNSHDQENIFSEKRENDLIFTSVQILDSDECNETYNESDDESCSSYGDDDSSDNENEVDQSQVMNQHVINAQVSSEQSTNSIIFDTTMTNVMQVDTKKSFDSGTTEYPSSSASSTLSTGFTANRDDALKTVNSKVNNVMLSNAYENEINYVKKHLDFNILLMGAPRIGKSQLANALTGNTVHRANTSSSLAACTQRLQKYEVKSGSLNDTSDNEQSKVFIWDTKGIENWGEENIISTMFEIIDCVQPIAFIYCAAPGTFANLSQVGAVLNYCAYKKIFCATVVTNMWAGSRAARMTVKDELEKLLENFGPRKICEFDTDDPILKKHEVTMFGDRGLCTMVNSEPFVNLDLSPVAKPIRGIDELTHCIMQSLSEDKVRGWCQAVLGNRSFWEKINHQTHGFVLQRYVKLRTLAASIHSNLEAFTINVLSTWFSSFF